MPYPPRSDGHGTYTRYESGGGSSGPSGRPFEGSGRNWSGGYAWRSRDGSVHGWSSSSSSSGVGLGGAGLEQGAGLEEVDLEGRSDGITTQGMADRAPATAGTATGVTAVDMAAEDAAGGKQRTSCPNAHAERASRHDS
jgi:hypothetical protein